MLSQSELKYLKSLHQLKYRQKYGIFIVEGVKLAGEVLNTDTYEIEGIYALSSWLDTNNHLFDKFSSKIFEISTKELERISLLKSPNQVLITLKAKSNPLTIESLKNGLSLYLEDIRDPGNFGTILRIADWFGVKWVLCSNQCVEFYNPKVIQASMGAF